MDTTKPMSDKCDAPNKQEVSEPFFSNLKYTAVGIAFGIVFVKAEIISWFRMQEMFRFQSFHMYGVIGSAVAVGMLSVFVIKKFKVKTASGEQVVFPVKPFDKGKIYGGLLFGFGWALTGACPGPLFALMGAGYGVMGVAFASAVLGTWCYGYFKENLPH